MDRAMAWLPCPVCGKEAKADVMATFIPEQYCPTDEGGTFVDVVYLRYKVKKHRRCKFECDLGKIYYIDPIQNALNGIVTGEYLTTIIDDFQEKMEKGEIEWSE